MSREIGLHSTLTVAIATALLAVLLPAQIVVPPTPLYLDPAPNARFVPAAYSGIGTFVWDRHRFDEDPGNATFALARNFVNLTPAQAQTPRPDVLVLNYAHFLPAEGEPAATRLICRDSIEKRGLQLYINYGGALIDPGNATERYLDGTFFISTSGSGGVGSQTAAGYPVPKLGFEIVTISATRAALGNIRPLVDGAILPPIPAIYVTASIGYALSDIDPGAEQQLLAIEAATDRLMVYDAATSKWVDESFRVPDSAKLGNSSGVAFADFDGDGHLDLYVGLQGDNFAGQENVLLMWDTATSQFVDRTSTRVLNGEYTGATNEVQAADLDLDGDQDIVVANRGRRGGPIGAEAYDYYLLNDGTGHFTRVMLGTVASDSRSVAVANLDEAVSTTSTTSPEIIFANAGSDGLETDLELPVTSDHPMQIFKNTGSLASMNFVDGVFSVPLGVGTTVDIEKGATTPQSLQVVAVDLFAGVGSPPTPQPFMPDGWLDLIVVNFREQLKSEVFLPNSARYLARGSNVATLVNRGANSLPSGQRRFTAGPVYESSWLKCVAVGDFLADPSHGGGPRDFFIGRANRHVGRRVDLLWNTSANYTTLSGVVTNQPFGELELTYDVLPGTEHPYGFDFADFDADGIIDALQTSRGYDYLVTGLDDTNGHIEWHKDFTTATSPQKITNTRGRKNPKGLEDGVFADFDGDGDQDIMLAGQIMPSASMPTNLPPEQQRSTDTPVIESIGSVRRHSASFLFPPAMFPMADDLIDWNGRTSAPYAPAGDRVVAGDLDNDDDIDAIVQLVGLLPPSSTTLLPELTNGNGFPPPVAQYSASWRYLENIVSASSPHWFRDVAATKMQTPLGVFSTKWNRKHGFSVLADFDNNGHLDLYTTYSFDDWALNGPVGSTLPPSQSTVEWVEQTDDLFFLNAVGTNPAGILTDMSASLLPPRAVDEVNTDGTLLLKDNAGSFSVAQGDIDNDGDADAVVMHHGAQDRTTTPWLLINKINVPGVGKMVDEWKARMDWSTLDPIIATKEAHLNTGTGIVRKYPSATNPGIYLDHSGFSTLFDWDGDGDLDLLLAVENDVPRFWRNKGVDSNGDGLINASDAPAPGTFEDATSALLGIRRYTIGAQDMMPLDLDADGDLDFAIDAFTSGVEIWRNEQVLGDRPRISEIWPRVGRVRGGQITLHGANLDNVDQIEFRFANNQTFVQPLTSLSPTRATAQLPTAANAYGLAQVRVRRVVPGNTGFTYWSRQYQSYFILK